MDLLEEFTYLEKLIDHTWGDLITSQTTKGMKKIQEIVGKFEELFQYIGNLKNENKNTSLNNFDLKVFNNLFLQLEDAMLTPDYILLGDLLKYEVLPLVKKWRIDLLPDTPPDTCKEENGFGTK